MIGVERLACSVRGCGLPLAARERALACARGHAFDLARSGYANLLQPQDRRSARAGDARETVAARERLARAGVDAALRAALGARVARLAAAGGARALLDVGCGPGVVLAAAAPPGALAFGLDLSVPAVDAAARRSPGHGWIVANADRRLPFQDASLDLVLAIKGPRNPAEFARVLAPGGRLLLAACAPDDLDELRRASAGGALPRDPAERALALCAGRFVLEAREEVRERTALEPDALRDLLRVAYRGARHAEARRADALEPMAVTQSSVLFELRSSSA